MLTVCKGLSQIDIPFIYNKVQLPYYKRVSVLFKTKKLEDLSKLPLLILIISVESLFCKRFVSDVNLCDGIFLNRSPFELSTMMLAQYYNLFENRITHETTGFSRKQHKSKH